MPKIDLKKNLKSLYNPPSGTVVTVDVPQMNYLMVGEAIKQTEKRKNCPSGY